MDNGLSNYKVNAVCKDNYGFMWFGTNEGLNRYDGHNFKVFKNDVKNSSSISNNLVRKIITLQSSQLCIATDMGVDLYNEKLENFTHILYLQKGKYFSDLTWTIFEGKDRTIWIGSTRGLFFKKENEAFARDFSETNSWFKNYEVTEVFEDKDLNLWIGTREYGIFVYNQVTKKYHHFINQPQNSKSLNQNWIEAIYQDSFNDIWVGTNDNGLNLFNPTDSSFTTIAIPGIVNNKTRVRDIDEDKEGRLWIASYTGLYLKLPGKKDLILYASMSKVYSKLLNNSLYDVFIDDNDILWLGTFAGGVNYCDLNQKKFRHFESGKNDNRYLNDRIVYAVVEDKNKNLWIGTERGGINYYNLKTGLFSYFNMENTTMAINNVRALLYDYKDNLWVGTYKGLYYFNTKTKTTTSFFNDPKKPESLSADIIYNMVADHDNNLWLGTRLGVDLLPKGTKKFIHFPGKKKIVNGFTPGPVHCVLVDSKNNIWIGTATNGLYKYNRKDSDFVLYSSKIVSQAIHTICEDRKGNIWIGGTIGIYYINTSNNQIIHYAESEGLPINTIFRIIDDKQDNLWISTTYGLTKFVNAVNTPDKPKFVNYTSKDGLFIKQFTNNSYYKSKSGQLFFGGVDGFVSFYPDQIRENTYLPKVAITQLKLFNREISIGQKVDKKVILPVSVIHSKQISLTYKSYVITIEFAGLHYTQPDQIKYQYKLEGFDQDWNNTAADKPFATYTNLSGGKYNFFVKATNNDGKWSEPILLELKILPPFWQTWWFYLIVFFVIIVLVVLIIVFRTKSLLKQKLVLEKLVNERTTELSEVNVMLEERQEEIIMQNEELALHRNNLEKLVQERTVELEKAKLKAEESDRLKLAFLANMSHEIRTPMNAIVGFSHLLYEETDAVERKRYFEIVNNHSESLLVLINDIIDVSMIESNQLKMNLVDFDPIPVLVEFEKTFQIKNTKSINICFVNKNSRSVFIHADLIRFRQVIANILDNALKYTEAGHINFGFEKGDNDVIFYFHDTGIGVSEEHQERIFNYFEKIEDAKSKLYRGTGIGLSICKKIIELMGGKIWVKSDGNSGSSFYFSIPMDTKSKAVSLNIEVQERPLFSGDIQIIIAEDETTNYFLLERYFKQMGLPILFHAWNGEEIVSYLKNNAHLKNAVILMDIKMPLLNGIDALAEIRKFHKSIPVIALTAYATEIEKAEIMKHSFAAYISKPVKRELLFSVVKDVMGM
jgi:signal transduction histidine kinase/ligand-binding sensor domain-containing protein/CheY-like chemotaxis protein